MRYLKHFLAILFIIAVGLSSAHLAETSLNLLWFLILPILIYQLIAFLNRSNLKMKAFFTSPFNLFTSKYKLTKEFDLSADTLFEKALEELTNTSRYSIKVDREAKVALTTTPMSLLSWGENIYISVIGDENNRSTLIYESVAFQVYSWGKNENNGSEFLAHLEESFII